jgi:hypothetical protein
MATHESFLAHHEVEGPSDRSFGLTVGGILVALALVGLLRHGGEIRPLHLVLLCIGVPLIVAALVHPSLLGRLNRAWMRLGLLLFKIVNPVVMFLIFALTVVPVALVMRLRGRDPLRLRRDPAAVTYWIERDPPGPAPESMVEQF